MSHSALLLKAAAFAADRHRNQRRKDVAATPYINHPLALAELLANDGGIEDPIVLCAALLHDTIEDTETTAEELGAVFGDEIAGVVLEVTDEKLRTKAERRQRQAEKAPHLSPRAKQVKLADKICNLRDILATPPAAWTLEEKRAYFDAAAAVVDGLKGVNPALERLFSETYQQRS